MLWNVDISLLQCVFCIHLFIVYLVTYCSNCNLINFNTLSIPFRGKHSFWQVDKWHDVQNLNSLTIKNYMTYHLCSPVFSLNIIFYRNQSYFIYGVAYSSHCSNCILINFNILFSAPCRGKHLILTSHNNTRYAELISLTIQNDMICTVTYSH